jgi:hypothetical protein
MGRRGKKISKNGTEFPMPLRWIASDENWLSENAQAQMSEEE